MFNKQQRLLESNDITLRDLVNEGWINFAYETELDIVLKQEEIDELVFNTWGWALKLNVKKLKKNKELIKRVNSTDFYKVFIKKTFETNKK